MHLLGKKQKNFYILFCNALPLKKKKKKPEQMLALFRVYFKFLFLHETFPDHLIIVISSSINS